MAIVRSEICKRMALKVPHLPTKQVEECGHIIIEAMKDAICRGERVEIRKWGSFELRERPERVAHDPSSGRRVLTPPRHKPHFKPGGDMRRRVNESRHNYPLDHKKIAQEVAAEVE